jgi:hypothetical protein
MNTPSGRPEKDDNPWHFKKTIDVGHVTTTVILALAAFWWFANLDKRVALLEAPHDEMRQDIKDIKILLGPLPMFMATKNTTDTEQDRKISVLEQRE